MRKLMMLAAMLALVVVVGVAPALANSNGFFDRFGDNHNDLFANNDFFDNFFHNNNDNGSAGIEQSVEQETQSGDVSLGYSVTNSGDYASQCTPAIQFGNTGNFNNTPVFQQYSSKADDFESGGIEFVVEPETAAECDSTIQQSAAASSVDP